MGEVAPIGIVTGLGVKVTVPGPTLPTSLMLTAAVAAAPMLTGYGNECPGHHRVMRQTYGQAGRKTGTQECRCCSLPTAHWP